MTHAKNTADFGWMAILVVVVVIIAGVLRLINWISPPMDLPLLVQAEGMQRVTTIDDPRLSGILTKILPTQTFDGKVWIIGLYPDGGPDLTKNSISVVYEKEDSRMMQIDLLSESTIENVLSPFLTYRRESVVLSENRNAQLINIKTLLDCLPARTKEGIGSCRFTRMLVFEIEPGLVARIAVDGDKVTDGELLEIARSMSKSIDETLGE